VDSNQNNETGKPATDDLAANEQNTVPTNTTSSTSLVNQSPLPETTPPQTQPPMEVHHHGHVHEKKKWKEYLFQFLMLFLAVFCGFIAENMREHYVEGERAKALAKNLYKELYTDSINVQQKIATRNIKESECAYFIDYVKDSSLTSLSPRFYPAFSWAFVQTIQLIFEPNDGILNQLRNSGELRYFKSTSLQSKIGELSIAIANVRSRNEKEYNFVEFYLRPFTIRHYDFDWYEALTQHGKLLLVPALTQRNQLQQTGQIMNLDKFNRKEAENTASYYRLMLRGTRQGQYIPYSEINHQLLEILRKEYHPEY
jgi:hypothetical protein